MIAQIGEEALRIDDLEPIDRAEKNRDLRLQLATHLAEIIRAVPVEDHELGNSLPRE